MGMKYKGYGIVWDAEHDRPLCEFVDGEVETIDPRTIEIMNGLGYEGEEFEAEIRLEDMTVTQLKAFAAENEISLGSARTKEDILKAIVDASVVTE